MSVIASRHILDPGHAINHRDEARLVVEIGKPVPDGVSVSDLTATAGERHVNAACNWPGVWNKRQFGPASTYAFAHSDNFRCVPVDEGLVGKEV